MTNNAAVLRSVEKRYKDFTLGPIDLTIPTGTIVGLVGENGAGKTTTLKLLCGVNPADAGEITLLGSHPTDPAIRARLGVVFEDAYFYSGLNAEQIGKSMAGIFGDRWNAGQFADYLQRFGLDAKKKVSEYSRGMRMKLSLATALAHNPDLLVLDEATAGLDPVVRSEMLDLFLEFIQDEQHSILLSSHITSDLEKVADYIVFIHEGQIVFELPKDEMLEKFAVVKCARGGQSTLAAAHILGVQESRFDTQVLVDNAPEVRRANPGAVLEAARIDDIMTFFAKGGERK